jgi:hypothetical protein
VHIGWKHPLHDARSIAPQLETMLGKPLRQISKGIRNRVSQRAMPSAQSGPICAAI